MTKAEAAERAHAPVRTCIGCRRRRTVELLVRVTGAGRAIVVGGPSAGRGAWLCRVASDPVAVDNDCLAVALRRRAFERAFRRPLGDEERRALEGVASARRPDVP